MPYRKNTISEGPIGQCVFCSKAGQREIIFEWIPYDGFSDIKGIGKDDIVTVYSAIWKDGQLRYDKYDLFTRGFIRVPNEKVALKCLDNPQNGIDKILNKIDEFSINNRDLKIYVVEWIPYNQFNKIEEIGKSDFATICLAVWKDGPLHYDNESWNWTRNSGKKVALKCLNNSRNDINRVLNEAKKYSEICKGWFATVYSAIWKDGPLCYNSKEKKYLRESDKAITLKYFNCSQNVINEFLNEAKNYSIKKDILSKDKIYGISRKPNTEDYILILYNEYSQEYFKECYVKYGEIVGYRKIFTNWISGNEKIDNLIQEMQSKINLYGDILFEWIPYNQFIDIEKIGQGGFATVYSATWKNGPLRYYKDKNEWIRSSDKKVALKCLNNSQNINNEFLNEVKAYSVNNFDTIERQPFSDFVHDSLLVLDICKGIRPEINEKEAPGFYIDLMKKCWDSNPVNRPNVAEIEETIISFYNSYRSQDDNEIKKQFQESEKYRSINKNGKPPIHPQAIYTSRLLNPFTEDLDNNTAECLDCKI
ncbi:kinase-like domain-containing protein [Rhizophagus irregularis DAOM 181602=DAOM 197198]|nr:kinase-like domain-containing protein [Rhizophagus irregularis DAOM 181602=DAOM 197198]